MSPIKMSNNTSSQSTKIWLTIGAVVVALCLFAAIWILGAALFTLFDSLRGLGNSQLQAAFREVVVPSLGGYLAVSLTLNWFEKANPRFLFFGFSAVMLILAGAYLGFVGPRASQIGSSGWGMLLATASILCGPLGAYFSLRGKI